VYTEFFGLRELPFELTPNPRFLFLSPRHREALATLQHAITTAKGIAVLIGEAGTGKTTLVRTALELGRDHRVRCLYLNNPALTREEFVEYVAKGFGLSADAARSKASFLIELERALINNRAEGKIMALVVDEAQSLPYELLEEIRLLGNIETASEKLLPIILAGQPELAARLNEPSLRQLKQRVALRCELTALSLHETASYIAARIRVAGGDSSKVFTREAVVHIHEISGGIPRTIGVMCDNALVAAFALDRRPVSRDIVLEVSRDFDLKGASAATTALATATVAGTTAATTTALASAPATAAAAAEATIIEPPAAAPEPEAPSAPNARPTREPEPIIEVDERAPKRRMFSFF
jgi:general secretion pathway protein A